VAPTIASGDEAPAPLRLPLGVDSYRDLHAAYEARLALLERSRDVALSGAGADGTGPELYRS
jgi:hypothetical protein